MKRKLQGERMGKNLKVKELELRKNVKIRLEGEGWVQKVRNEIA